MILAADSMSLAFRSFIFFSAISRSWARVMLPALVRPVVPEPDVMPAACFRKKLAGGVLVTKVKLLS